MQYVFIIGAPRSGSSWLHRMISSHPEVASTNAELTVFSNYVVPLLRTYESERRKNRNANISIGLPHILNDEQFDNYVKSFIENVYSNIHTGPDHKVILDKHPYYSFHTKEICRYMPTAKFINIIRDGRDMADSWRRMALKNGWGNADFAGACMDWIKFNNAAKFALRYSNGNYMEVRYESLISNTSNELQRVFSFCNISGAKDIVNKVVSDNTGEHSLESESDKRFSFNDRITGKALWKEKLSLEEKYIAGRLLADPLKELGYESNDHWRPGRIQSISYDVKYKLKSYFRIMHRVSYFLQNSVKTIAKKIIANKRCAVCGVVSLRYLPLKPYFKEQCDKYGYKHWGKGEGVNIVQYSCSSCRSSDRDRLYALYFKKVFSSLDRKTLHHLLDIAPYKPLGDFVDRYYFIKRRTADLYAKDVDDKINIEDMGIYADNTFDFFICSHVLEHVERPDVAMKELFRVLKPGGKGIAMVPILIGLDETLEDPSHTTEEERWRHYGQGDHLRQFGKRDFIERLQRAGFRVNLLGLDYFGRKAFRENGIMDHTILYIVEKEQ